MADDRVVKLLAKVAPISDEQVDQDISILETLKSGYGVIQKAVDETKALIMAQSPDEPVQGVFSFMPTNLTRISPFFPMPRGIGTHALPPDGLVWENAWGHMTLKGEKLSIYDETILLACLSLMGKYKAETFETTRHELCKEMGVIPAKNTYHAVWAGLERLAAANIRLAVWIPGTKKKKALRTVNSLISAAMINEETGRISLTIDPYFRRMYAENLATNINIKFRAGLKGDISKALYRFFRSQQGMSYECHLLTLCRAINLDVTMDTFRLRARIKQGFSELKKAGYLKRSILMKSDIIKVWKKPKGGACTIEDAK